MKPERPALFSLRGRVGLSDLRRGRIRLVLAFIVSLVALVASWVTLVTLNDVYGWTRITPEWCLLSLLPLGVVFASHVTLMVRRLHDHGRSGWWLVLMFAALGVPVVFGWFAYLARDAGFLAVGLAFGGFVIMIQAFSLGAVYLNHTVGQPSANRFGPALGEIVRTHNAVGLEIWFRRWRGYPVHWKGWAIMTAALLVILPVFVAAAWLTGETGQPWAFLLMIPLMPLVIYGNLFILSRSG